MKKIYPEIYKLDTKGKARVWYMEQDGDKYRTIAGIKDGNLVTSEWTLAQPTNVGRSNERDGTAQATFEIEAAYTKKLTREYHKELKAADAGAHFFKPMLAEKFQECPPTYPGLAQPKLDGIRCLVKADGMFSRQGKPITAVPHIWEELAPLFEKDKDLVLDGELYNHELKDDFEQIVSIVRKKDPDEEQLALAKKLAQYHVYDLPAHKGIFSARTHALKELLKPFSNYFIVQYVETISVGSLEDFDIAHGEWLALGYEGSMFRADDAYEQKRTKALLKRKEFQDAEFEVVKIEEGLGNWAGVAKKVLCRMPDGRTFGAGIKGSRERAKTLLHEHHKVVTIRYFRLTSDGIPRFGVATKFHGEERTL